MSASLPDLHWDNPGVESMYDKTLLAAETAVIRGWLRPGSVVCDFGCGEGEATAEYAGVPGVRIHAYDKSKVRLGMARERLRGEPVAFLQMDILDVAADPLIAFHTVISQRLLINLPSWDAQKCALENLCRLSPEVILSEGSLEGMRALNEVRSAFDLPPIPPAPHNVYINDMALVRFMSELGYRLVERRGLGAYYLLTRGVQPALTSEFSWNSAFNKAAATDAALLLPNLDEYSRVKLWRFERPWGAAVAA